MTETAANPLDALLAERSRPTWRPASWSIMAFLGLFIVWALFAQLDEVAVALGEVVPAGKIKTVQHLEGGIIEELFVRDGDTVRADTPLMQINLGQAAGTKEELQIRLDGLLLARARLAAEAEGKALAFPPEVAARQPQLVAAQQATHAARLKEFTSTRAVLDAQVRERTHEISEVEAKLVATDANLTLARERLGMSEDLLRDGLTSRMEHSLLQGRVAELAGEVASLRQALPRARASLTEAQERVKELDLKFSREAQEQLVETELNIARTEEMLGTASEQAGRTTIRSPTTGIVKNMRYNTVGGVIRPGEPVMDIVPSEDALVIEAKLNPVDRGFVRAGQKATVKIDTYDYARYGGIEGEVTAVAPDSTTPENGAPYFKVMVTIAKPYLGEDPAAGLNIAPGMGATVDIHTGTKSVMSFLLRPVLKLKSEAFRER
jgi:adhesin transport system membrane fusion protein